MKKIVVTFRDRSYEIIDEQDIQPIIDAYGDYTKKRISKLFKINGKYRNADQIIMIDDYIEPKQTEPPISITEAMRQSINEEKDTEAKTLKEKQMKIWKHNLQCIKEKRMADYIYYKIEGGKLLKTTKEEAEKRLENYKKQQLLEDPRVIEVVSKGSEIKAKIN